MTAQHGGHALAGAAKRHVLELNAGFAFDLLDDQMAERAAAWRSGGQGFLAAQPFHVVERLELGALFGDQHVAVAGEHGDMGEVPQRVVADVRIDRRAGQHRPGAADQQRIAVGWSAGDLARADRAGAAGDVLDIELLLEGLRHFGRQHAREQVGGAARRERHHDLDGLRRPSL